MEYEFFYLIFLENVDNYVEVKIIYMTNYTKEITMSKIGVDTLKINGYLMHSSYNPIREAEQFVKKNYKPEHAHILFGYGLGYIVEEFIKIMNENDKLIIIEPLLEVNINHENVITFSKINNIEEIKQPLYDSIKMTDKIHIICSPNYDKVFPEIYKEFLKLLKDNLSVIRINENTIKYYSEQWQKNYLLNLPYAVQDYSISQLEKVYDCPVVIASGGPSLTKQIPVLKKYRNKLIIVAAGSTINSLLKNDIEPDYVISIDGSPINYEHYKNIKPNKTSLVYFMSSYPKIREVFNDECYYGLSTTDFALKDHLMKMTEEDVVVLPGGGSCAHYALTFATYITSGPITLIGQDLAFTDNKSHADHNVMSKNVDRDLLLKKGGLLVEGYNDDMVLTDYMFVSMKETFERLIQDSTEQYRIFNSTEGGVKLKGYSQIPFVEFCQKHCTKQVDKKKIATKKLKIDRFKKLQGYISKEIVVYNKIEKILNKNEKLIKNNKSNIKFSNDVLTKLEINDKKFESLVKDTALKLSLDPINLHVLKNFKPKVKETPKETYDRVKAKNLLLYSELNKATKNIKDYAKLLLEKIEIEMEKCSDERANTNI